MLGRSFGRILCFATVLFLGACSSLLSQASKGMARDFATAVLNEDDPQLVREAAPSYLMMMDALLIHHADRPELLLAAAQLNSAYASSFVDDPVRAKAMSAKALHLAFSALCLRHPSLCTPQQKSVDQLSSSMQHMDKGDVPLLMTVGTVWAGWIQLRAADWNAVADLPRVRLLMQRVVEIEPDAQQGAPFLYLGAIDTLLPPALGGRQKQGIAELDEAVRRSDGHDLMAKVIMARQVARTNYDRPMHDRLLNAVVAADPHASGWTLENCLAQDEARKLLKSADDYF